MMDVWWYVGALIGVFVLIGVIAAMTGNLAWFLDALMGENAPSDPRYRLRADAVLTEHERAFVPTLERAARQLLDEMGPLRVLAKVNLADLIEPDCPRGSPKSPEGKRWWGWWQSINRKHADFVLVDAEWRPVCVVELDDASHRRASAKKRDAAKDAALSSAGVSVVRVTGRDGIESVVSKVRGFLP